MTMQSRDINKLTIFLKEKGFIYQGSSIYGGLANSWDFGPLGTLLKENIKKEWTKFFITTKPNSYLVDTGIILNPRVWKTSGHIDRFSDPLLDCKNCKTRYRADKLLEEYGIRTSNATNEELTKIINSNNAIVCKKCGSRNWTEVRNFDLMFKTSMAKTNSDDVVYLRPETAQGVYVNFKNVVNSINPKLPISIGQIGKAFRNEVTPGNFIFRTKEFEQMELEIFCKETDSNKIFKTSTKEIHKFLKNLGIKQENIREYDVPKKELAHYSSKTIDFEYNFPFGWGELMGLANRTDFDLKSHQQASGENLEFLDTETNTKFIPHIIEGSIGVERSMLAVLSDAYFNGEEGREVLKLPYALAPYKLSVSPLASEFNEFANKLFNSLLKKDIGSIKLDLTGSIGKRYARNDAIGTPFVVTIDQQTLSDKTVTIRNRDTKLQERIKISKIPSYLKKHGK